MAFNNNKFCIASYCNGWSLWYYTTDDDSNTVFEDGYFNNTKTLIYIGDVIICNCKNGTAIRTMNIDDKGNVVLKKIIL